MNLQRKNQNKGMMSKRKKKSRHLIKKRNILLSTEGQWPKNKIWESWFQGRPPSDNNQCQFGNYHRIDFSLDCRQQKEISRNKEWGSWSWAKRDTNWNRNKERGIGQRIESIAANYQRARSEQPICKLCLHDKEVIWIIGKNKQYVNFHARALLPRWIPLFKLICSRLTPRKHKSHLTLYKAVLPYAMIQKKNADAGWATLNDMIN